ncbi:MAG: acyltransferase family protein [Erysipelotrichaceae bacterium]|nr:acyltransferase family protein [Erysipelotrichaceae bacterium]
MQNRILTKENSKILQGIAILMMVYHHIFIDGNLWFVNEPTSLLNMLNFINIGKASTFQMTFAWFCKICVAIFAFTSGFGIFAQLENKCKEKIELKEMYKYCFKRFLSFFKVYAFCFLFFNICQILIVGFDAFDYSFPRFIINLLGLAADYNGTLWYVPLYYCMIFISPLVYVFLKRVDLKKFIVVLICAFVLSFAIAFVSGNLLPFVKEISKFIQHYQTIYILIFMEGMFCGKYELIEYIYSKLSLLTSILLVICVFIVRTLLIRAPSDSLFDLVLIVPFVVGTIKAISYSKLLIKLLSFVGKYSAYIWYSHAYFYSYLFFDLVIRCDMSLLVYIQVVTYSLTCGILFSKCIKLIEQGINKLKKC